MTTDSATQRADNLSQIEALFKMRGAELRCPVCGHETMNVFDELESDGATVIVGYKNVNGVLKGIQATMPTVTVACNNCGLIRQFAKAFLDRGMDASDGS
jgi:transcription elongation factor Elf1